MKYIKISIILLCLPIFINCSEQKDSFLVNLWKNRNKLKLPSGAEGSSHPAALKAPELPDHLKPFDLNGDGIIDEEEEKLMQQAINTYFKDKNLNMAKLGKHIQKHAKERSSPILSTPTRGDVRIAMPATGAAPIKAQAPRSSVAAEEGENLYIGRLFDSDEEGQAGPSSGAGVFMREMDTVAQDPTRRMRRISAEEKASSEGSELGVSGFGEILLRSIVDSLQETEQENSQMEKKVKESVTKKKAYSTTILTALLGAGGTLLMKYLESDKC